MSGIPAIACCLSCRRGIGARKGLTPDGLCSWCCPKCGSRRGAKVRRDRPGGVCIACWKAAVRERSLLAPLTPRQYQISVAVQAGATPEQVAEHFGFTTTRAYQLFDRVIEKLRERGVILPDTRRRNRKRAA